MTDRITIEGGEVIATSPEGQTARMPLEGFLAKVAPRRMDTCGVFLPFGIKTIMSEGGVTIWVYELSPRVHSLRWIADDSPVPFGKGGKYRIVRIALPYLIVLAVFAPGADGQPQLSPHNECFFRTAPLNGPQDELLYPALLNCSKFVPPDGRPLSWICTQHLNFAALLRERDLNKRLCASFEALRRCLLETGFNYSSENHEASSWFSESRGVDPRISAIETWQAASEKDPLFVLGVPWLKTGCTLQQVAERIFRIVGARRPGLNSAAELARILFNQKTPRRTLSPLLQEFLDALS